MAQRETEHVDNTNESENADVRDIEKRVNHTPPLRRNVLTALVQDFGPFWYSSTLRKMSVTCILMLCQVHMVHELRRAGHPNP